MKKDKMIWSILSDDVETKMEVDGGVVIVKSHEAGQNDYRAKVPLHSVPDSMITLDDGEYFIEYDDEGKDFCDTKSITVMSGEYENPDAVLESVRKVRDAAGYWGAFLEGFEYMGDWRLRAIIGS